MYGCLCAVADCRGHHTWVDAILHDHREILHRLHDIQQRLGRIEHAQSVERKIMSEVDDRLAQVALEVGDAVSAISASAADVDRALADLKTALAGSLTPAQVAQFDAVDTSLATLRTSAEAIQAAVDAVDVPPAPEPPAPVGP